MPGEGAMMHMITSLKNNKRRRKNHVPFNKHKIGNNNNEKPEYDFPEATPEVLAKIKSDMIKEQKSQMVKTIIIFIVLIVFIIYIIT